jgi:uncharacterized repeat protein (TIGR03843 family)
VTGSRAKAADTGRRARRNRGDERGQGGAQGVAPTSGVSPSPGFDRARVLDLLATGEIEIVGRMVEASNLNLYCRVTLPSAEAESNVVAACVYKPIRGERPLDDFPDRTLGYREVAAYRVSEATGWNIVPPTVLREGPLGPGMLQLWIDIDESVAVVDLIRAGHPALRRMAVFDAVINNADRKGGHMLPVPGGHVYGVDHGVCFSTDPKLRTILWGWRGRRFAPDELAKLEALRDELDGDLGADLGQLLAPEEVEATAHRIRRLLARGTFPQPDPNWPAIPWPPF